MSRFDDLSQSAKKRRSVPELPTWWSLGAGCLGVFVAVLVLFRLGSDSSKDTSGALSPVASTVFAPSTSPETTQQITETTQQITPSTDPLSSSSTAPQTSSDTVELDTLSGAVAEVPRSLVEKVTSRALSDTLSSSASVSRTVLRSEDVTGFYIDVTLDLDGESGDLETTLYYSAIESSSEGWRVTRVK